MEYEIKLNCSICNAIFDYKFNAYDDEEKNNYIEWIKKRSPKCKKCYAIDWQNKHQYILYDNGIKLHTGSDKQKEFAKSLLLKYLSDESNIEYITKAKDYKSKCKNINDSTDIRLKKAYKILTTTSASDMIKIMLDKVSYGQQDTIN